jgi:putative ABC transport system substrate-binding protein
MRRRDFITLLGGMAVAWPVTARAQQAGRLPTIGYLGNTTPSIQTTYLAAFVQRLRALGWVEGRTIAIEYRWAEGRSERYAEIAAEFVRLRVDVIVTAGNAPVIAAKQATSVIPIVFAVTGDPLADGVVASLAHPGGNVTGLSNQQVDTTAKRVELLREVFPGVHSLAILASRGASVVGEIREAARKLGLDVLIFELEQAGDIVPAFDAFKGRVDALLIPANPLTNTNGIRINILAAAARLPTMYANRDNVVAGGLMSYAPNIPDQYRRAAEFVDKILRGAKPADIPVEQPTKFELVVNLTTAKALGLKIPETILVRADEVIE